MPSLTHHAESFDRRANVVVANGTRGLSVHGFHEATLITAVLVMGGGVIGAVGIRNP